MKRYFPSGISVTQARKDAKKIAATSSLTLSQALDVVAHEHVGVPWHKAMAALDANRSTRAAIKPQSLIVTYRFPFENVLEKQDRDQHICFGFESNRNTSAIIGKPGVGKSVAALKIALQHILAGFKVSYCLPAINGRELLVEGRDKDFSSLLALQLKREHSNLFSIINCTSPILEYLDNAAPGQLIIMDEVVYFMGVSSLEEVSDLLRARGAFLLALGQVAEDVSGLHDDSLAFALMGVLRREAWISNGSHRPPYGSFKLVQPGGAESCVAFDE